MLHPKDLLLEGEVLMGQYQTEIAQWREDHWMRTLPPLYVILTDHRFILQPNARKKHDPAIIPAQYVTHVQEFMEGRQHGILLRIKTGHHIAMFVQARFRSEILQNIHTVITPTAPPKKHKIELDINSLKRIITRLGGVERPKGTD